MKRSTMTDPRILAGYRKPEPPVSASDRMRRKPRICLGCQTEFESEWCGERICTKCKNTKIYR